MTTLAWILLALGAATVLWAVLTYNALVTLRNRVEQSWSGIDVQLKRRHDLVPNLVETVRAYAAHERATLEAVTRARTFALTARLPGDVAFAESGLSGALGNVRALAEAYPDLKAAANFQHLQAELAEIEDEISAARRIYNSNVQLYNTKRQVFPSSIVAAAARFEPGDYFEITAPAERAAPAVVFA